MAKKNQLTTSDYMSEAEFKNLLNLLRADKEYIWELYARVSFYTACRSSDVLKMKWSTILDKEQTVVVETKTKKARKIKFTECMREKIHELYDLLGKPPVNSLIFANKRTGEHITIQYVNQKLKSVKEKYNLSIDHFSTHTFRKTFGRYVYESCNRSAESLILLNKILNHTSIQITKTYIGITQDEIDGIYETVDF